MAHWTSELGFSVYFFYFNFLLLEIDLNFFTLNENIQIFSFFGSFFVKIFQRSFLISDYELVSFYFNSEFISHRSLLYPILLSEGVYSTLFVLYANKCSKRDEIYRQRIQLSEKKTDDELMGFLKLSR